MERLEKTADVPKKQEWHRKNICKTCYWLRDIYRPSNGWDGKCCVYTYETECFREISASEDYCAYYLKKKRNGNRNGW